MTFSTAKNRWPSAFHGAFEGHLKSRRPPHFGSRGGEVALGPLPCVSFREVTPAGTNRRAIAVDGDGARMKSHGNVLDTCLALSA